jgi:hypothetical protein
VGLSLLLDAGQIDWPPDDLPRPEDEPTEPIEGLGAGLPGDEPTLELPIIGGFEETGPPAPGRRWLVGAGVAATALVLAGVGTVAFGNTGQSTAGYRAAPAVTSSAPGSAAATKAPTGKPSAGPVSRSPSASGPLDGRTKAGFDVVNGAAAITLRTADLGEDLYRVTTPSVRQRVTFENGRVRLFLGQDAPRAVQVVLSSRVRWDLRIGGGTEMSTIDLSGARLTAVDLSGGAGRIVLTLPKPDGTLTVQLSGGVNRFDVHTAGGVPVRVRLGSGAGQVVLDGTSHSGVAAGALFTSARWDAAVDRIDLDARAGMSAMTIGP